MIQELSPGIYDLSLKHNGMPIHPVLLWNEQEGATLIDTGMTGTLKQLQEAVQETGVNWNEIRRIILTHQDIDHIGNLPAIAASLPSRPEIWAHKEDSDVIEGRKPFLKMSAERLASMPEAMRQLIEGLSKDLKEMKVTRFLEDGEELSLHGGLQVIHTPGHTPGHLSFYLPKEKLLLAADELNAADGELKGPNEPFTPDMELAMQSMTKFLPLAIERILCYHGGMFTEQPEEAIRRLAQQSK
ncbi:MBL fold metallo-hydrolase [Paenibacillus pinistramenti]|uniref:MBL fold metallo-hydrolase n=1 Tax=Paenibacillus pinistramenti TaxID=1768003 RepID=UPI0013968AEB|nr:MBL fold metallo-hydrolase [Paenibacillus pinistramenti]